MSQQMAIVEQGGSSVNLAGGGDYIGGSEGISIEQMIRIMSKQSDLLMRKANQIDALIILAEKQHATLDKVIDRLSKR